MVASYPSARGLNMGQDAPFGGAKCALFLGDRLAVLLRDDNPGIPFPAHWDFPGGGREGGESPFDCARRECEEELGISFTQRDLLWSRFYEKGKRGNWFFVAQIAAAAAAEVRLGSEGQRWSLMRPATYLAHPRGIPHFQERLRSFMWEGRRKDPPLP